MVARPRDAYFAQEMSVRRMKTCITREVSVMHSAMRIRRKRNKMIRRSLKNKNRRNSKLINKGTTESRFLKKTLKTMSGLSLTLTLGPKQLKMQVKSVCLEMQM